MTKKERELEQKNAELTELIRQLLETQAKPSKVRWLWDWCAPYIVPVIFGLIVGGFIGYTLQPPASGRQPNTTLEQQAALGGAVIPFPSGSPLLMPSTPPLQDWMWEPSENLLTSTSEKSSESNPQADNGQTTSTRYYRLPLRRMR